MDPHKRSAAIEVMTADEAVAGGGRYGTDAAGLAAMLAAVRRWPERTWAVEGSRGTGRQLASWLVAAGERVVDVPPKLSARTRVFTAGQGRKTDATDAHAVALATTRSNGLHPVTGDAQLEVLRVLANRRRAFGGGSHPDDLPAAPAAGRPDSLRGEEGAVRGAGPGAAGPDPATGCGRAGPPPGRRRADRRPRADLPAQEGRRQGAGRRCQGHRHHADEPGRDRAVRRRPAAGGGRGHRLSCHPPKAGRVTIRS